MNEMATKTPKMEDLLYSVTARNHDTSEGVPRASLTVELKISFNYYSSKRGKHSHEGLPKKERYLFQNEKVS